MRLMKDAFLKAGIAPETFESKQEKREKATRHLLQKAHAKVSDQQMQMICENCQKTAPDVEYYEHRVRVVRGNWLCLQCADGSEIDDSLRKTAQSQHSKQKTFKRRHGRTNRFVK